MQACPASREAPKGKRFLKQKAREKICISCQILITLIVKVKLFDNEKGKEVVGTIAKALKKEMPTSNWQFDWKSLYSKNSLVYKLSYEREIQGLLKMTKVDEGYYEMSNLELSPENYGAKGKYDRIAGALIAYACLLTFELNAGNYKGYLAFTSKGKLIPHYEKHYYAELVFREKMIIFPKNGKKLIKKYLDLKL